MATQGNPLIFENSYIDNFVCENLELPIVEFRSCNVQEMQILKSNINQWTFYLSKVSGKIENSNLNFWNIYGGEFYVTFKDSIINQFEARHSIKNELSFEYAYRIIKKLYADQGDDKKAIEYFLLEKSIIRKRLKSEMTNYRRKTIFKESKITEIINKSKNFSINLFKYIGHNIDHYYWGYGRKPYRILFISGIIILFFSVIYYFNQSCMNLPKDITHLSIVDSLYYSIVTFTTLGYGDFTPTGILKIYAAIEAIFGPISFGFLVAGFSNFKY